MIIYSAKPSKKKKKKKKKKKNMSAILEQNQEIPFTKIRQQVVDQLLISPAFPTRLRLHRALYG